MRRSCALVLCNICQVARRYCHCHLADLVGPVGVWWPRSWKFPSGPLIECSNYWRLLQATHPLAHGSMMPIGSIGLDVQIHLTNHWRYRYSAILCVTSTLSSPKGSHRPYQRWHRGMDRKQGRRCIGGVLRLNRPCAAPLFAGFHFSTDHGHCSCADGTGEGAASWSVVMQLKALYMET